MLTKKQIKIFSSIILVVAIILFSSSYLIGIVIEQKYNNLISSRTNSIINTQNIESPQIKFINYDRGVFDSQANAIAMISLKNFFDNLNKSFFKIDLNNKTKKLFVLKSNIKAVISHHPWTFISNNSYWQIPWVKKAFINSNIEINIPAIQLILGDCFKYRLKAKSLFPVNEQLNYQITGKAHECGFLNNKFYIGNVQTAIKHDYNMSYINSKNFIDRIGYQNKREKKEFYFRQLMIDTKTKFVDKLQKHNMPDNILNINCKKIFWTKDRKPLILNKVTLKAHSFLQKNSNYFTIKTDIGIDKFPYYFGNKNIEISNFFAQADITNLDSSRYKKLFSVNTYQEVIKAKGSFSKMAVIFSKVLTSSTTINYEMIGNTNHGDFKVRLKGNCKDIKFSHRERKVNFLHCLKKAQVEIKIDEKLFRFILPDILNMFILKEDNNVIKSSMTRFYSVLVKNGYAAPQDPVEDCIKFLTKKGYLIKRGGYYILKGTYNNVFQNKRLLDSIYKGVKDVFK